MSRVNVNISAPNLTTVCVDRVEGARYIGRLYHKYQKECLVFYGIEQLVSMIDRLCDTSGYPKSTTQNRTFRDRDHMTSREEALQVTDIDHVLDQKGSLATFVVHVKYRQHSTWQGEVVWVERQEKRKFRSALELLKLMDNALENDSDAEAHEDIFEKGEEADVEK